MAPESRGIPRNPSESLGIPFRNPSESLSSDAAVRPANGAARAWTLPILVRETTRMTRRGPHAASGLEEGPSHRQELPGRARHPLAREPPQKNQTSEMKNFEAKPGRRAGVGNVGKAASQHPRRPRIAAPVQAQELAAARRRLASFKPVCQTGMSEISPPARRSCSCGRTCRRPNRTLARAEKGARQNLPQFFPQFFYTQI